jgi:glycosyltransferase involved in cell wall biosynthesis
MSDPLLSVCLITYNHAKYIRQAIEGVLMQKVNFTLELIIADDFSTDGTREIILEYKEKYPEFIKLILQKKNVGAEQNWLDLMKSPFSKYTAYFEGDDYWIDPLKLQKQLNFLESEPGYGLVFTDADLFYERTGKIIKAYDRKFKRKIPTGNVIDFLLYNNPYKSCTSMFRNDLIQDSFHLFNRYNFRQGDLVLWLLIASQSNVGYLDESTSVYRIKDQSASHFNDFNQVKLFHKNKFKTFLLFSKMNNINVNKKLLKTNYKRDLIDFLIEKNDFIKLTQYCNSWPQILYLLIKQKVLKKIIKKF